MVPQAAPHLRISRYRETVRENILRVLDSDQYVHGRDVEHFEKLFADYIGVADCITVNSGTDALALALRALGIGEGDEVLTVSMTAAGTAMAIQHCGAEPRFVDIDPQTRCMDLDKVAEVITRRTAAIVPVHLHGYPMDMTRLVALAETHGLAIVEDCAQAHGAHHQGRRVGSFGQAGIFSFYPTKNLGCIGDGGAVVTNDPGVAGKVRSLRSYGWAVERGVSQTLGFNSRLDELQAGVLSALLPHLDQGNQERALVARQYREAFAGRGIDMPADHPGTVYHQFVIAVEQRDELRRYLRQEAGILTGIHYAPALHQQPAFAACARAPLPVTEDLARRFVSLPIQPEVTHNRVSMIAQAVLQGLQACKAL